MNLTEMIGETIIAKIPAFDPQPQRFKLHGVEAGEIGVKSQKFTDKMLKQIGVQSSPRTLVLFLPYHQIAFAIGSADSPALSEEAFGV